MDDKIKESLKSLNDTMKKIEKAYGAHIMAFGNEAKALTITRIPSGSFGLDVETGGGIPEDRVTVIAGQESSSKTTILLKIIANAQKKYPHRPAAFMDFEGTFDPAWAQVHGVDLNRLIVIQPEYTEQGMDIADALVRSRGVSVIGIDSLAAMLPGKELEASFEDNQMGVAGYLNSKFLRKMVQALRYKRDIRSDSYDKTTVVIINQLREKVGQYGNPEIMPGGRAIKYTASLTIMLRQGDQKSIKIAGKDYNYGHEVKFSIAKNKTDAAKATGVYDLYTRDFGGFKAGDIDRLKEVTVYGVLFDVIIKRGGWYYINDDLKFQGGDKLVEYLRENPAVMEEVEVKVLAKLHDGQPMMDDDFVDPDGE